MFDMFYSTCFIQHVSIQGLLRLGDASGRAAWVGALRICGLGIGTVLYRNEKRSSWSYSTRMRRPNSNSIDDLALDALSDYTDA